MRPGLRLTNDKKRVVIAFGVDAEQVSIIGVFYGGQDYETILQEDFEDEPAHCALGALEPSWRALFSAIYGNP